MNIWENLRGRFAALSRERMGLAALSVGIVVATGVCAFGGFGGCQKPQSAATIAPIPVDESPAPIEASPVPVAPKPTAPEPRTLIVYVTGAVKRPGVYTLPKDARLYHAVRAAGGFKPNAVTDALNLADRAQDGDQLCIPARQKAVPHRETIAPSRTVPMVGTIRKAAPLPAPVTLSQSPPPPDVTVLPPPAPARVLGVPAPPEVAPQTEPLADTGATAPTPVGAVVPTADALPAPARPASHSTKFKNPGDGVVHINTATAAELQQLNRCGPEMSAKILAYRAQIGRFTDLKQLMDVKGVGEKTFAKWEPFLAL